MPGHGGHGSVPHSPADGAPNVPSRGPGTSNAEPTCGSPTIDAAGPAGLSRGPGAAGGWLITTTRGSRRRTTGSALGYLAYDNACEGASFPPHPPARPGPVWGARERWRFSRSRANRQNSHATGAESGEAHEAVGGADVDDGAATLGWPPPSPLVRLPGPGRLGKVRSVYVADHRKAPGAAGQRKRPTGPGADRSARVRPGQVPDAARPG